MLLPESEILKIRGLMLAQGYTLLRVALELDVRPHVVSQVVSGASVSRRIQERIAGIIGYWPWPPRPERTNGIPPELRAKRDAQRAAEN